MIQYYKQANNIKSIKILDFQMCILKSAQLRNKILNVNLYSVGIYFILYLLSKYRVGH